MPDYLPRSDDDFDEWFENFLACVKRQGPQLGLTENDLEEIGSIQRSWSQAVDRHRAARQTARDAAACKKKARQAGERTIRKYVRMIQARPATTNQQRRGLGISLKPEDRQESPAAGAAMSISEISLAGY
jgi:hypothetical protein